MTIYTDLDVSHLALELRIPVGKLHSITQSSRRKSPLRLTLFAFDNVDTEVTEELIGSDLYKQYNFLRRNHQKKLEESLDRSRNSRTAVREKLDISSRVKEETVYYSEDFISALESTMAMGVTTDAKLEDIRLGHKNLESPDTNRAERSGRRRSEQ